MESATRSELSASRGTYPMPADNDPSSATTKKRKLHHLQDPLIQRATFPRKRSVTACQLCRTRKTKCNNDRPVCAKCSELNAQCTYEEDETSSAAAAPGTRILERLEYLIDLVEAGSASRSSGLQNGDAEHQDAIDVSSDDNFANDIDLNNSSAPTVASHFVRESRGTPECLEQEASQHAYFGSGLDVLDWPVFEGNYDRRWIEALIFDPTLPCDDGHGPCTSPRVTDDSIRDKFDDPRQSSGIGVGVREDDVPHLIETFLANVHVKNPIFDPAYLRNMAKSVAEHGFDWKAPSCLVLFVCALASISSRFIRQSTEMYSDDVHRAETSLSGTSGYHTAESYYTAACKRLGLLKNTLIATECHFLAGVYEMYSLRPLQAAISFNRACVTFQTLTWMRSEYYATDDHLGKARASRLYWSCLKSEHETSIEIKFPSSGLTKINYTSHFPAPPLATAAEDFYRMHSAFGFDTEATSPARIHNEFEEGWYYYLADIAARRLLQRVISSLYHAGESAWVDAPYQGLLQTAEELNRQLSQWHRTLPELITFEYDKPADTELAYHLQARALEIRERIYRPFLFRSAHKRNELAERAVVTPLVQLHASACTKLISHWDVRHRHHGTWLMARQSFTSALLLSVGRLSGLGVVDQESCKQSIRHTLSTLRFWEAEAPDLKASRLILQDVSNRV